MPITKIKKRNGTIVDFDRSRIESAIAKAFNAASVKVEDWVIPSITEDVISVLEIYFKERTASVEDTQDIVEKMLIQRDYFDVARSYIVYREEHKKIRQQEEAELLERVAKSDLSVTKRNGEVVPFNIKEIEDFVAACAKGLDAKIDIHKIVDEVKTSLYDGIKTSEINQALAMVVRAKIEKDPIYSFLAARILFNDVYRSVLGVYEVDKSFNERYHNQFAAQLKKSVDAGRLDPRILTYDLDKISKLLKPERDHLFHYLGAETLHGRYFLRDNKQALLETPQYFWMRIAMGLALNEKDKDKWAAKFYEMLSTLRYVASTPTLFHSGTTYAQMSSCYLTTVEDDLTHIFKSIADNAELSKWSGGLGNDWTNIRGTGSLIKSTNVHSQGVIPFLNIADATTAAINRSGKRRGATCVYLETWHYDIEDFLELRKNTGDERRRTHDTNTANWIPDLFMKRMLNNEDWTLFSPDETPDLHHIYGKEFEARYSEYEKMADEGKIALFKRIPAQDLWKKMITMLFSTGHPWMTWKDACNVRSPQDHVGVVHSSNLCTEITLNTSADETAVCNLGSVNLARHVTDRGLDKDKVEETVTIAMRMLDNVVDLNYYPTKEARNANMRHRPVGLGIMGLQNAFYIMGINFDSDEAVRFSDETQEFISYYAILSSSKLAKEKGAYSTFKGSKWDRGIFPIDSLALLETERGEATGISLDGKLDWQPVRKHVKEHGMRNSNTMAIAPTATIANISGCFPTIEPIYKNIYVKSNQSGEFTVVNEYLINDLKKLNLWNDDMLEQLKYNDGNLEDIPGIPQELKDKYKEVFQINSHWIIQHAAHRAKWIDQSQSVNLFTRTTSGREISEIYIEAWRRGLKTTYYLRTLAASQVEKSTSKAEVGVTHLRKKAEKKVAQPVTAQAISADNQVQGSVASSAAVAPDPLPASNPSPVEINSSAASSPDAPTSSSSQPKAEPKLCKIEDPDCEACQ
ncbi:MAG: ribonucleoside-diphosphate reductase subunit alpha [Candidatus Buchananbacteria bacterium CG10_big_fil_rev_8_21_14_0_10_42_9]|uniref:Ribonucleoside-diphosphate reductase n=1 Tax=Candidatus Buchananbacteria bacterium CG10_big_fil_rev_8_21_14_0_10_42_9 TaxID=1974526 RepID=A0A2H0W082_9BACT|nr:MAG: ribonucleoside-diphosphate reductase subunit alpha [Candidatus Buchananbacteria bacterium CG10_big_fil_rev_8_21_14_0_10_42_9]